MKTNRLILAAVALVLTVAFAGCGKGSDNPNPDNSTGTVPDGWIPIRTAAELDAVRDSLSGNYILMNDISLSDYSAGAGWAPIGDDTAPFTGEFDGDGHKVTGLTINRPGENYVGLFGYINGGSVSNLGVEIGAGGITGCAFVGGIAGCLWIVTITNCYSTGDIYSRTDNINLDVSSGGIAGNVGYGTITNCCSMGDVSSDAAGSSYSGGIVGNLNTKSSITNCYSTGSISAYSNGVPTSASYSGGIAGVVSNNSSIAECYSAGNVSASASAVFSYSYSGGIAGIVTSIAVTGCAAINPTISATAAKDVNAAGRITVGAGSTISNNFALSTMAITGDQSSSSNGVDKSLADLKTQATYSDPVNGDGLGGLGWAFGNDDDHPWKMPAGGGYPILYWQK